MHGHSEPARCGGVLWRMPSGNAKSRRQGPRVVLVAVELNSRYLARVTDMGSRCNDIEQTCLSVGCQPCPPEHSETTACGEPPEFIGRDSSPLDTGASEFITLHTQHRSPSVLGINLSASRMITADLAQGPPAESSGSIKC